MVGNPYLFSFGTVQRRCGVAPLARAAEQHEAERVEHPSGATASKGVST